MSTSFDTSSLILMKNNYPEDIFPSLWKLFDEGVRSGRIVFSEEVVTELSAGTDGLDNRIKRLDAGIVRTDKVIEAYVVKIMTSHPNLVDLRRQRSGCDPYVVAAAQVSNGSVVTEESAKLVA